MIMYDKTGIPRKVMDVQVDTLETLVGWTKTRPEELETTPVAKAKPVAKPVVKPEVKAPSAPKQQEQKFVKPKVDSKKES